MVTVEENKYELGLKTYRARKYKEGIERLERMYKSEMWTLNRDKRVMG